MVLYIHGVTVWPVINPNILLSPSDDLSFLSAERRILHISWHDFVSNDEVLHHTGLSTSHILSINEDWVSGHVARLLSYVPANSILRICAKMRDSGRPSQEWRRTCGRTSTTWVHQICHDTGVSATEALLLAEDKPFWRTIATAGSSGWSLCVMIDWLICMVVTVIFLLERPNITMPYVTYIPEIGTIPNFKFEFCN